MLFCDDPDKIIGIWTSLEEDERGLEVRGELTPGAFHRQ